MESITIEQIVQAFGYLTAIAVFFMAIYKWYKAHIADIFDEHEEEFLKYKQSAEDEHEKLRAKIKMLEQEMQESKEERLILLKGQLACLKGLHNDLNCNGPVTQGIEELEKYLIEKSHK